MYELLQERIDELRKRIQKKREEAQKLFASLLSQLEMTMQMNLPEEIIVQINSIKKMLGTEPANEDQALTSETVTVEDLLQSISSLTTATDATTALEKKRLEAELKKAVSMRLAMQNAKMPKQWHGLVGVGDYIQMLNNKEFSGAVNKFGGSEKLMAESIRVAEASGTIFDAIAKMATQVMGSTPGKTSGIAGIER